jgi:hypothetical protein
MVDQTMRRRRPNSRKYTSAASARRIAEGSGTAVADGSLVDRSAAAMLLA